MIVDEKPRCQLDCAEDTSSANPAAPLLIKSNSTDTIATLITFIKLTQMIRTLIITFVLSLPAMLVAFSTKPNRIVVRQPAAARTTLYYHPDVFEKAVDCAQNYGMCDVDELLNLAKELDQYDGCYYEDEAEGCQKEIDDRHDLVDALLLQTEMQQRDHYVKEGNLFAYDVKADKDMQDRDNFIDKISPALDV